MSFLHLFIVNKSGGLIHHRALSDHAPKISTNEWLRIASTFHSLHAIASEASPIKNKHDDGIQEIRCGGMILRCLQTVTGIKFILCAEPTTRADLEQVCKDIYLLYTECVLKDPFYELEMPIRSELFVQAVDALLDRSSKGGLTSKR